VLDAHNNAFLLSGLVGLSPRNKRQVCKPALALPPQVLAGAQAERRRAAERQEALQRAEHASGV
jgi:hypothetical protein